MYWSSITWPVQTENCWQNLSTILLSALWTKLRRNIKCIQVCSMFPCDLFRNVYIYTPRMGRLFTLTGNWGRTTLDGCTVSILAVCFSSYPQLLVIHNSNSILKIIDSNRFNHKLNYAQVNQIILCSLYCIALLFLWTCLIYCQL